ncbi:MAG: TIGR04141 family sporadically distributed protein [Pseudomonadota bacterium]
MPYRYLNALLAKNEFSEHEFNDLLASDVSVTPYDVSPDHGFEGVLYVKNSQMQRPRWSLLADAIVGAQIDQLGNKSSSAVLLIRIDDHVFAFTFGYGRFLLNIAYFVQDFGLKTALNTLNQQSLRSVDLHTLEDQPIQKKSQAVRGAEASVFGIDIFRDVLRAVTGSPRAGVGYKNISGGDAIYSFGLEMQVNEFPAITKQLLSYYQIDLYKSSFGWVDNIRRVKDRDTIKDLDDLLVESVRSKDPELVITLPEIIAWDNVHGFSFTRSKRDLSPTIDTEKYLENINVEDVSIESIKKDRLFVTDVHENKFPYSIYTCIYFEIDGEDTKKIIFGGHWYEVDKSFMSGIEATLSEIDLTDIEFPGVEVWVEDDEKKIENEGDYNIRAAEHLNCYLLDKKLVKCTKTTTPIELCDLLTTEKQLIHVKHRKGGSAGLSHLFAQGGVAAEVLLGDKRFRKEARKVLKRVNPFARDLVPINSINSPDYEVVFLILGNEHDQVKAQLPFFSKVNLTRTYENLAQRGFRVKIGGAQKVERIIA